VELKTVKEKTTIIVSLDCSGPDNCSVSGGIGTHIYEIYSNIDNSFKDNLLVVTGSQSDSPRGVETTKIPYLRLKYCNLISFHLMASLYLLYIFILGARPRLVHIHYIEASLLPALVGKIIGCDVLVTAHGYFSEKYFHFSIRPAIKITWHVLVKVISELIVLSEDSREYHLALSRNRLSISVVPNGVIDENTINNYISQAGEELNQIMFKIGQNKVVIFAGRLAKEKNVDSLINAFNLIEDDRVVLWIVGDGPDKESYYQLAKQSEKSSQIKFWGWQSKKMVYMLMKLSDVFVLPSLWEGMPIALLEAYSVGLKCICHANGATRGIPGVLLLNTTEPIEISDKIITAMNTDLIQDKQFIFEHSWSNSAKLLLSAYQRYFKDSDYSKYRASNF